MRFLGKLMTTVAFVVAAIRAWQWILDTDLLRARPSDSGAQGRTDDIAHTDGPVDHHRAPGVPPPSNDDYAGDLRDLVGAGSFPASDPPGGW